MGHTLEANGVGPRQYPEVSGKSFE